MFVGFAQYSENFGTLDKILTTDFMKSNLTLNKKRPYIGEELYVSYMVCVSSSRDGRVRCFLCDKKILFSMKKRPVLCEFKYSQNMRVVKTTYKLTDMK